MGITHLLFGMKTKIEGGFYALCYQIYVAHQRSQPLTTAILNRLSGRKEPWRYLLATRRTQNNRSSKHSRFKFFLVKFDLRFFAAWALEWIFKTWRCFVLTVDSEHKIFWHFPLLSTGPKHTLICLVPNGATSERDSEKVSKRFFAFSVCLRYGNC